MFESLEAAAGAFFDAGDEHCGLRTTLHAELGRASLEVDHIIEQEKSAWSVIARGNLHHLSGTAPSRTHSHG